MSKQAIRSFKSLAIVLWAIAAAPATAGDAVPGTKAKRLAIYPARPGACYVQLRPVGSGRAQYVQGENYPVCRAVLANLNKFCGEAPPYNRHKLHPSIRNLEEPAWRPLDPAQNLDVVKETFTSVGEPGNRVLVWRNEKGRVTSLAESGVLKLWTADIDIDSNGTLETVYMLENQYPNDPPQVNYPTFMVAQQGQRMRAEFASRMGSEVYGDLWKSADEFGELRWHSINFDPSTRMRFLVQEIVNYGDMGAVTRCTIQHINDYRKK